MVERVMKLAGLKKGQVFYDLGSGDGRLVIAAALRGAKAYGVEIDCLRVWYSRFFIWLWRLSGNAKIMDKNFFEVDLSKADVVSVFLLQETNQKMKDKLKKELKKGAKVISCTFTFDGWKPVETDLNEKSIWSPVCVHEIK